MDIKTNELARQSPPGADLDFGLLWEFEASLDPLAPESSAIPCRVLGYGEISTVFQIQADGLHDMAYKRMSIFETPGELEAYLVPYNEYIRLLSGEIGLQLPAHGYAAGVNTQGRPILYIIQEQLDPASIGSQAIHQLPREQTLLLVERVLEEIHKVWEFNQRRTGREVAIDGQISNWSIQGFSGQHPKFDMGMPLRYLDTSTPLLRIAAEEQLDPELFLRSAPSFLVWIIRLLFLDDVMNRYYDFRKVAIDLVANFYKEGLPELIPDLIAVANTFLGENAARMGLTIAPIEEREVRAYYREDALIWWLYLSMRRVDRFLHRFVLRRAYPYILPGKIKR